MGSFFKQVYRYSHARPYRHNENLWPYVKIARGEGGEIAALWYKHRPVPIVPLSELRNSCWGEVLLTATGPSVKTLRFENIPAMPAIGVNGAYFLHRQVDFRFYVIVDMGFIDSRPEIVHDVIQRPELTLFTTVHGVARILDRFGQAAIGCRLAIVEDAACKIYHPGLTAARCGSTTAGKTAWSSPPRAARSVSAVISAAVFLTPAPWPTGRCKSSPISASGSCLSPGWT